MFEREKDRTEVRLESEGACLKLGGEQTIRLRERKGKWHDGLLPSKG